MIKIFAFCILIGSVAYAGDFVSKTYIVEGMSCGGCAFSVERALQKAGIDKKQIVEIKYGESDIPSPTGKISVGHVTLSFNPANYHGQQTDCLIIRSIDEHSGYAAYTDPKNRFPCSSALQK